MCAIGDVAQNKDGIATSLGGRTLAFLSIVVTALMLPNASWMLSFGTTYGARSAITAGAWLAPSSIIPVAACGLFLGRGDVPMGGSLRSTRLRSSAFLGSLACAAITFTLLMMIVPATNQAYREHVFDAFGRNAAEVPRGPLRKGINEMTLPELNAHIRHAPSSRQADLARASREERFAFVGSVFVLGLLGLALAGRWRSRLATFGVSLAILVLYGLCFGFGAGLNKSPDIRLPTGRGRQTEPSSSLPYACFARRQALPR